MTPTFGVAYQAVDPTRPAMIAATVNTQYTVTIAGTQADEVNLRIGPDSSVSSGGGFVVGIAKQSLTGITLSIGMAMGDSTFIPAMIPANWWYSFVRVSGTTATILEATVQSVGAGS